MHFIAQFQDGDSFSGKQGYWDDCPNKGITALHVAMPFNVRNKATGELLEPSTIMLSGYEDYYFAKQAKNIVPLHAGMPPTLEEIGVVFAGIDYTHDFVNYYEMDKRGNIKSSRFTIDRFMKTFNINKKSFRKGIWQK